MFHGKSKITTRSTKIRRSMLMACSVLFCIGWCSTYSSFTADVIAREKGRAKHVRKSLCTSFMGLVTTFLIMIGGCIHNLLLAEFYCLLWKCYNNSVCPSYFFIFKLYFHSASFLHFVVSFILSFLRICFPSFLISLLSSFLPSSFLLSFLPLFPPSFFRFSFLPTFL